MSPDGQRFLMIAEAGNPEDAPEPFSLIVVQNWLEELRRLVPRLSDFDRLEGG